MPDKDTQWPEVELGRIKEMGAAECHYWVVLPTDHDTEFADDFQAERYFPPASIRERLTSLQAEEEALDRSNLTGNEWNQLVDAVVALAFPDTKEEGVRQ